LLILNVANLQTCQETIHLPYSKQTLYVLNTTVGLYCTIVFIQSYTISEFRLTQDEDENGDDDNDDDVNSGQTRLTAIAINVQLLNEISTRKYRVEMVYEIG